MKRILSINGTYPTSFLATVDNSIVGTSTGGIISLGIGLSAKEYWHL